MDKFKLSSSTGTDKYLRIAKKGLSRELVIELSREKNEPEWMLEERLKALSTYQAMPVPKWGADLSELKWEEIHYYLKPVERPYEDWKEVPEEIKRVFDAIGVPEAEREHLSGVTGQYDSEKIYGSLKKSLAKKGVVFLSMDEGLQEYPEIVKKYWGSIVPSSDNKLAALNTAIWSGGSFVYVPRGVKVLLPLQAYFRINSESAGQFERTMIVVEEGAEVHYVEGCFVAGTMIVTEKGENQIERIQMNDSVLSHSGRYQNVNYIQKRKFTGDLYQIQYYGDSTRDIKVTEEHPLLTVKRRSKNDRNKIWKREWLKPTEIQKGDYLSIPIDKKLVVKQQREFVIKKWVGRKIGYIKEIIIVNTDHDFFRLVGYYLAEGSISSGSYLNFSFSIHEKHYIEDVKKLVNNVFGFDRSHENIHRENNGITVVFNSVRLCRIFEKFGKKSYLKRIPEWMLWEDIGKQRELVVGWFRGDGNYYSKKHKSGYKEAFRINTTSDLLARQMGQVLRRLEIPSFINIQEGDNQGRKAMYTVGITGEWMHRFGEIVNIKILRTVHGKARASMFGCDGDYIYVPIKNIISNSVSDLDVYNFGVEEDESYVANGIVAHNCSAPAYSSASLHAAVVEVVVKKGATCRYTTVQNWYKNVYNLVTKRAEVGEEAAMEWVDANIGSRVTMKYPACLLKGRGASGSMLSIAVADNSQQLDTGAKMFHLAPNTKSEIVSKSISKNGGRASYRGLVSISPKAMGSKSRVVCDALILDSKSRSDTYPTNRVMNSDSQLEHEAYVSRISQEQIEYLMSRGLSEGEAQTMIVRGFLGEVMEELPMEYSVELNRLVKMEMEGSVG